MAILIPSKNIYDKQNPKVRDNVIERIEVAAVEVVPDNEYETPVYNEKGIIKETSQDKNTENGEIVAKTITTGADIGIVGVWIANSDISNQKVINKTITIPKVKENHWIYSILYGKDKDGNNQIKYSLHGNIGTGTCSRNISWELPNGVLVSGKEYDAKLNSIGDIIYNGITAVKEKETFDYYSDIISSYKGKPHDIFNEKEVVSTLKPKDISSVVSFQDKENEYVISIDIMSSITVSRLGGGGENNTSGVGGNLTITGTYEVYTPTEIEITIYGNTIGIDLTDKTVYINGETAKKVHSVDGNELMQTSNYYQHTDTNAIEKVFSETLNDYTKGKETATIRCSISDYYDFNSGDKVLSIDNSTGKMSFKMYDRVIPMVYGADGKDRPMSSYQDGKGKVFQVLGSKIYYDGAVWQELSLQETYNSYYAINFSQAKGAGNERFTGYGFEIQGVGKILINGVVAREVNSANESQTIKISNENGEYPSTADIEFVGCFSRIATIALSSTSAGDNAGTLNKIISYDNSQSETYPYMFYYQIVGEKNVYFPSFIDTIAPYTFYYATSSYTLGSLIIPKHIKKIGERAFSMSRITSIKFLHDSEAHIFLPTAGSETGMFYVKSARNVTIYTDNEMIKNYDWATDNITPTFYHLDGTVWE